jgi:hypothetical protein
MIKKLRKMAFLLEQKFGIIGKSMKVRNTGGAKGEISGL